VASHECIGTLGWPAEASHSVDWAPDGKALLLLGKDGAVKLWSVRVVEENR
jgi:hypothetical protein